LHLVGFFFIKEKALKIGKYQKEKFPLKNKCNTLNITQNIYVIESYNTCLRTFYVATQSYFTFLSQAVSLQKKVHTSSLLLLRMTVWRRVSDMDSRIPHKGSIS